MSTNGTGLVYSRGVSVSAVLIWLSGLIYSVLNGVYSLIFTSEGKQMKTMY